MVNKKNKNNSSDSLVFGRWAQTKIPKTYLTHRNIAIIGSSLPDSALTLGSNRHNNENGRCKMINLAERLYKYNLVVIFC